MKKTTIKIALCIIGIGVAIFWGCNNPKPSKATTTGGYRLPQDVKVSCAVTPAVFKTWFVSDSVTENGVVMPANSVTFPHTNNCSFYQWSEQMFLWMTSPKTGGGVVMDGPLFYDVTPTDSNNQRFLVPHTAGMVRRMTAFINQTGPNKLPVIFDKKGRLYEVEKASKGANPMVTNAAGKTVQVDHVEMGPNGTHIFKDKAGNVIDHPKPLLQHKMNQMRIVREFKIGKKAVYIDMAGDEVQTEAGQATGDVLMAQNGSIVYYLRLVNDVYAQFLTACNNHQMSEYQFPTDSAARDSICAIARANGVTLPDSNALAIEIKTSWIAAAGLPDSNTYITVMATVPTYNTSNPNQWIPNGEQTIKLALVGMHVVGSLAHHPEMAWATFEHQNTAPMAKYAYIDSTGATKIVPQDTGTGWLFSNTSATATSAYNVSHMTNSGDTINADSGFTVSASNTMIAMPWGSAFDSVTNQEDRSSAASNSEIIAINNAIHNMLVGSDIRKNYILIGTTWTNGGAPPSGITYGYDSTAGVSIGANVLANSTMETYIQFPNTSCFTCHSGSNTLFPDSLSHIFSQLQSLPAMPASMKKK